MHDLDSLIAHYTDGLPAKPTPDDIRSARYAAVEAALLAGVVPTERSIHIVTWVNRARELHSFVNVQGRHPRENNRAAGGAIPQSERALHEWVRDQRRPNTHKRSTYQRLRLQLIPGFSWDPHKDAWQVQLKRYRAFVELHRRAPRARSADPAERALADWAARQRRLHRSKRLGTDHEKTLRSLPIWAW